MVSALKVTHSTRTHT